MLFIAEIAENADQTSDVMHLHYIMHMLSVDEIEGLPPGGGLYAK